MIGYLYLELARTVRDGRYVVLAIAAPVGFYLLFAGIFGASAGGVGGLPLSVEIMVAMATFGAMWGALAATAPRLAADRETGCLRALQVMPLGSASVLAARALSGLVVALPGIVAVGITAVLAHGVRLAAWQWICGLALLWVGTLPFVALGIAIGAAVNSATAYALSTGLYVAFAALGGLWVPPSMFSASLRRIAEVLPSYRLAELGWQIAAGAAPPVSAGLVLLGWTAALGCLALIGGARRVRTPGSTRAAAASDAAICTHELSRQFGHVRAVDGIDLEIRAGSIIALLGPNGAGKTTTICLMLGLLAPDHGAVHLFGSSPGHAVATGRVGAMLQDTGLMAGVRVGELLTVIRELYPAPGPLQELIDATGIAGLLRRRTHRLSGGQAQACASPWRPRETPICWCSMSRR